MTNEELKAAATRLAWEKGRLTYKLKPVQKKIYQAIKESKELIYVPECSRRLGKTTTLAVLAIETAIQNINYHVHFGAPYQNALKDFLLPIFNQILNDCPEDLRPVWKQQESKWIFKSGSFIKLCGANNGQFDNLRGNKSDLFILDEAAQIDQLEAVIKEVALPQMLSSKNPNKKIILPSTPPDSPDHAYNKYVEAAKAAGAYSCYTIDESWYDKEEIERFLTASGGRDSTTARREYFCEHVVDSSLHILPEWNKQYVQEVEKDDYFKFYTPVEGLDIGYRDFTAWILGYYDYLKGQTIIEYEYALRENDFTTELLATEIKKCEAEYQKISSTRIRRISDNNNLNLLADLSRLHHLTFAPVAKNTGTSDKKHGKEWMVSQTRKAINDGKVIIHPRCKMLLASVEFGIWKEGHSEFARSKTLGHYDFVDALIYLISSLVPSLVNINPIPPLYKINIATTMFPEGMPTNYPNPQDEVLKLMFKPKF